MIGIKGMKIPKNCAECSFVVDDMCGGATNEMRVMKSWWNAPYKKGTEECHTQDTE